MKLIICGNGFDLHHNLQTSYGAYKEFLTAYYDDVLSGYENFPYLSVYDNRWSDVESALGIDYEDFMEDAMGSYPSALEDGDSKWGTMQIDVELLTSFIHKFTGECFAQWLNSVNILSAKPELNLLKKDLYINFNYTDTLQLLYQIPDNNILHIHGKLSKVDDGCNPSVRKEIQFGAVDINSEKAKEKLTNKYKEMDFFGVSVEPAIREICSFIDKSTKELDKNYPKLKAFLNNKEISEIVIMGHTLNGADSAYYKDILVPRYKDLKWTFMRYINEEKKIDNIKEIKDFIAEFELQYTEIIVW